jgi:hypothetical protein
MAEIRQMRMNIWEGEGDPDEQDARWWGTHWIPFAVQDGDDYFIDAGPGIWSNHLGDAPHADTAWERLFGDYARGRQGWLNRKNWGVGWSARGFEKDWGYKGQRKLPFPVARTVFRVKFGRGRTIDLLMGRWL